MYHTVRKLRPFPLVRDRNEKAIAASLKNGIFHLNHINNPSKVRESVIVGLKTLFGSAPLT